MHNYVDDFFLAWIMRFSFVKNIGRRLFSKLTNSEKDGLLASLETQGQPASRDDAIFSGENLHQEQERPLGTNSPPGHTYSLQSSSHSIWIPSRWLARKYRVVPTSCHWVSEDGLLLVLSFLFVIAFLLVLRDPNQTELNLQRWYFR